MVAIVWLEVTEGVGKLFAGIRRFASVTLHFREHFFRDVGLVG